ncbi:MAG TPA: hypothetical protein VMT32_05535 [Bryobacteraceae bacterium]|nr:hypothetical protein [Bryobacteraceae bacterium]
MTLRVVRPLFAFVAFAGLLSAADPLLMNLLMPDAKVVAGINVEQAKNSPFGQFLISHAPNGNEGFSKLTATTGFDPRRDLSEVLMATMGQPGQQGLVLARGAFDSERILTAATAAGHTVETYNGVNILTGKEDAMTHAVAFLGDSIAIAGDLDSVKGAIDRRANNFTPIDPALAAQVQQLSGSLDAWSVSRVPVAALTNEKLPNANLNGMLNSDVLKNIQQASGGIKFGAIVQISAQAVANSSQNATALADVIHFLGQMVQANAPAASAAAITALVQSLNVQADGNTVKVALAIPEQQLESLLNSAHSEHQQGSAHAPHKKL